MINNGAQTPYLNANAHWFHNRAENGKQDGSLTKLEQKIVHHEMREFREDRKEARADGKVTAAERKELWTEAGQINRDIFSLRHNSLGQMGPGGADAHQPHLIRPH